jgi:cytidine deaminase
MSISGISGRKLLAEAQRAALNAYAPYSNFRVGAAVVGASGEIYRGANIENASFGLSLCAERAALSAAAFAGDLPVQLVALACIDVVESAHGGERLPCGACRQWMAELAGGAEVYVLGESGPYRVDELLPNPFTLHRT